MDSIVLVTFIATLALALAISALSEIRRMKIEIRYLRSLVLPLERYK